MIQHKAVLKQGDTAVLVKAWASLNLKDNVGEALDMTGLKDATIQIDGEFGIGKLVFMGSNDKNKFHILKDKDGYMLEFDKAGIYQLDMNVLFIYPMIKNPDEKTDLTATICARRIS